MDKLSIALMGKIHQVYGNLYKDCWLSMNRIPQIMSRDDFDFPSADAEDNYRRYNNQCQFSLLVDDIPENSIYYSMSGKKLSDVYRQIIQNVIPIEKELSEQEKVEMKKIEEVLESDLYSEYKKFQEDYNTIVIEKNNISSSILNSNDEEFKVSQRKAYNEKTELLKQLKLDWIHTGGKILIEKTIQQKQALQQRGFLPNWQDMLIQFEMQQRSLAEGMDYLSTYFTPQNIFNGSSGWSNITLYEKEVTALYENSIEKFNISKEITHTQESLQIKKLSAKFCLLKIERNWFFEELFENKFWSLPEYIENISDGELSPEGILPSYPFAIILVKDVDIELNDSQQNRDILNKGNANEKLLSLGPILLQKPVKKVNAQLGVFNLGSAKKISKKEIQTSNLKVQTILKSNLIKNKKSIERKGIFSMGSTVAKPIGKFAKAGYRLQGKISLPNGQKAKGVKLIFQNHRKANDKVEIVSDQNGNYQVLLKSKNYLLKASMLNYATFTYDIRKLKNSKLNFQLKPLQLKFKMGTILKPRLNLSLLQNKFSGKVISQKGDKVTGVLIEFSNLQNDKQVQTIKTNEIGAFQISLFPGKYKLKTISDQFEPFTSEIEIPKKKNISITLTEKETIEEALEEQFEGIQLFGYLCKRIPKSPNPIKEILEENEPEASSFSSPKGVYIICHSFTKKETASNFLNSEQALKYPFTLIESEDKFRVGILQSEIQNQEELNKDYPDNWKLTL